MAQDFQTRLNGLAQLVQRSAEIQQNNVNQQSALQQTIIAQTEQQLRIQQDISELQSPERIQRNQRKNELNPLPAHYLFSANADESFVDHIEKLRALKCLQDLDNDEFIRTIKCSLTSQVLRVATAVNEEEFLSKRYGSRDYIDKLKKLFVSAQ